MSENKMKALPFLSMSNLNLHNKRVMIREDLNVPMKNGKITNDERIVRALPTIQKAIEQKARVMILSHLGRPEEGKFEKEFSLAPVARLLSKKLNQKVPLINDWLKGVAVEPGQAILCENVRFNKGENENNTELAKRMAELCDIFVMDAFATAHRAQASTAGVAAYAKLACAGPLLISEVEALSRALENPQKPLVAVVGGSKVSTKIHLLENLLDKVDQLIVGGGIANTFLKAQGYSIGKSLCENEWLDAAQQFWEKAAEKNVSLPLPVDVIVADELSEDAKATVKNIDAVTSNESIFDVGPNTSATYAKLMAQAGTIVWNGPIGVFEIEAFSQGTRALAQAVAKSTAYSIVGGGDTLAALDKFNLTDQMSYVSTAGGAFLEFLEGKILPAIKILTQRVKEYEQK
ncbi:phosphoglycerate kinase [Coxiella burnetii]|uniref:phosphoglycerate kinase n=1 Tax=Coxiella burnetii TaxID=777 RepID=UPI000CCBE16A|nr:phosphoglycerate kinase [Coxiella burnetii]PNT85829.1 phosphoglycerate kinase [Coxiella burnetii]